MWLCHPWGFVLTSFYDVLGSQSSALPWRMSSLPSVDLFGTSLAGPASNNIFSGHGRALLRVGAFSSTFCGSHTAVPAHPSERPQFRHQSSWFRLPELSCLMPLCCATLLTMRVVFGSGLVALQPMFCERHQTVWELCRKCVVRARDLYWCLRACFLFSLPARACACGFSVCTAGTRRNRGYVRWRSVVTAASPVTRQPFHAVWTRSSEWQMADQVCRSLFISGFVCKSSCAAASLTASASGQRTHITHTTGLVEVCLFHSCKSCCPAQFP